MELIRPEFPAELIDTVSKSYPENCLGCEYLRALHSTKIYLCVKGERPVKVDVLCPAMSNAGCKFIAQG